MAKLKDKIENALNECRILMLGGQVLVGASFRAIFDPGFDHLPFVARAIHISCLGLTMTGMGPLMFPAAYHQMIEHGENTPRFHRIATGALWFALLPFAIGMGGVLYTAGAKMSSRTTAVICGCVGAGVCVGLWYVWGILRREKPMKSEQEPTSLTEKIKEVLMECRMVLPGAQALLGFQLATMMMEDFDKLPESSKWIHFGSLIAIAIATVCLITPAAYHRIALRGEDSEDLHRISSVLLITAMFWIGLGLAMDFIVVVRKLTNSLELATVTSAVMLALFYMLWFGYTSWQRKSHASS